MSVLISLCSFFRIHSNFIIGLGTLAVTILILAVAFWAGKLAKKSLEAAMASLGQAEKVKTYQFLSDIILSYRSKEMLIAVSTLYNFNREMMKKLWPDIKKSELNLPMCVTCRRKLQKELGETYIKRYEEDSDFHHKRRTVKGFFELLAGIHKEQVIDDDTLFNYWNKETLSIIPNIIIPIEKRLFKHLNPKSKEKPEIYKLMRKLYNDCPERSK